MDDFDWLAFVSIGFALGQTWLVWDSTWWPFAFAALGWLYVALGFWKGVSQMSFIIYGMTIFSVLGAISGVMPYGLIVMLYIATFATLWMNNLNDLSPQAMIVFPLILLAIGGIAYAPYPDFQNTTIDGTPTSFNGCLTTCSVSALTLFPTSLFSPLLSGDYVGFFLSFFTTAQSAISFFSIATSVILLLLGLGIGGSISVLGSGLTINLSDSGVRMAQSMGLTMLLYGITSALFGGWFNILTGGWFGLDTLLPLLFAAIVFYGGYLQGKSITSH